MEWLACIRSERETQDVRMRVVVVDKASWDLPQIAQAVERNGWSSWVTLVLAPKNGGFAFGNNLGIPSAYEQGRPNYIPLFNPDTQLRPSAIAPLVAFLERPPHPHLPRSTFQP